MEMELGVNVDHVATVRQARSAVEPDPVFAASLAELGGADAIVVHLRGDRRHIQERDARILRQTVRTRLNMEMAVTEQMTRTALDIRPDVSTLVPERPEEISTEGGLDVVSLAASIGTAVESLSRGGVSVSIFIDPVIEQINAVPDTGAKTIEINTGAYAEAADLETKKRELDLIVAAAARAKDLGLSVAAGHGLNYWNVAEIAAILEITELNIGHTIISRAVYVGIERAVREMKEAMISGRRSRGALV
jgi:pyridoxine 5-phosphate synthase